MQEKDQALRRAFEAQMQQAGVTVPPARVEAVFGGYVELQGHIAKVRAALRPTDEPAHIFAAHQAKAPKA